MSEMLQLTILEKESEAEKLQSYQQDSHVNLTALQENVWLLMTSAIYGGSALESLAKLNQDGLWEKMSRGFCQVKMDDSLEEFCETWPDSGFVFGGIAFQPMRLAQYTDAKELQLLPSPIATDYKGTYKDHKKLMRHVMSRDHQVRPSELLLACGIGKKQIVREYETMMGFPVGWVL